MGIERQPRSRQGGQDNKGTRMRRAGVHYITAWGWGLTSPHSANRKRASTIINNSDCYLTQPSLHNMLVSQQHASRTLPSKPSTLPSLSVPFQHAVATKFSSHQTDRTQMYEYIWVRCSVWWAQAWSHCRWPMDACRTGLSSLTQYQCEQVWTWCFYTPSSFSGFRSRPCSFWHVPWSPTVKDKWLHA